jgi:hypothetical protein
MIPSSDADRRRGDCCDGTLVSDELLCATDGLVEGGADLTGTAGFSIVGVDCDIVGVDCD